MQLKLWPLENHYMFNSKRDNLKILTFKSLFASLRGLLFQHFLTVYWCVHNDVLFICLFINLFIYNIFKTVKHI